MAAGWVTKPPGEAEALIGGGSNITSDYGPVGANQKTEPSTATHGFHMCWSTALQKDSIQGDDSQLLTK